MLCFAWVDGVTSLVVVTVNSYLFSEKWNILVSLRHKSATDI